MQKYQDNVNKTDIWFSSEREKQHSSNAVIVIFLQDNGSIKKRKNFYIGVYPKVLRRPDFDPLQM